MGCPIPELVQFRFHARTLPARRSEGPPTLSLQIRPRRSPGSIRKALASAVRVRPTWPGYQPSSRLCLDENPHPRLAAASQAVGGTTIGEANASRTTEARAYAGSPELIADLELVADVLLQRVDSLLDLDEAIAATRDPYHPEDEAPNGHLPLTAVSSDCPSYERGSAEPHASQNVHSCAGDHGTDSETKGGNTQSGSVFRHRDDCRGRRPEGRQAGHAQSIRAHSRTAYPARCLWDSRASQRAVLMARCCS